MFIKKDHHGHSHYLSIKGKISIAFHYGKMYKRLFVRYQIINNGHIIRSGLLMGKRAEIIIRKYV